MLGHAGYTRLAWLTGTQMDNGCTMYPFPLVQAITIHLVFPPHLDLLVLGWSLPVRSLILKSVVLVDLVQLKLGTIGPFCVPVLSVIPQSALGRHL